MKDTLFAIGEALIDFIPAETGCDFSEVTAFSPKVGGAPANVLGAFAKLGGKTQLLTQLGDDPFGHKIADELKGFGVGVDKVAFTDKANTALAFVSLREDGDRTFSFYRNPSADMLYDETMVTDEMFEDCYALHFCSVSLGEFPMKDAHIKAINSAKKNGALISFDPNLRFPLWKSAEKLKAAVDEFIPFADVIKISDEEFEFITGCIDIKKGCEKLLRTAEVVVYTCGSEGAYAFTKNFSVFAPSVRAKAIDTTGAGDAFSGSFLYSLYKNGYDKNNISSLKEDELKSFIEASNKYCAASVCKKGAIESYPNEL